MISQATVALETEAQVRVARRPGGAVELGSVAHIACPGDQVATQLELALVPTRGGRCRCRLEQ